MSQLSGTADFVVISGKQVSEQLQGQEKSLVEIVQAAYLEHDSGNTVNPPSYFLTFPDRPTARIIALPASVAGDAAVDGIKWVSSFPDNIRHGLPRASAVVILNDPTTGYPYACLEASIISAVRTAASAALAADWLTRNRVRPTRLGIVGTGLIARFIHTYLVRTGWDFDQVGLNDLDSQHAKAFRGYVERQSPGVDVVVHDDVKDLVAASDLIVFATVAGQPYVTEPDVFSHGPLVLNVSLRDLAPDVILSAQNFVDDVEHCLKANTSVHLTEQASGNRDFLAGTLADVMSGRVTPAADRTIVFSPFGLGVLDLAVARHVHDALTSADQLTPVAGFFHELDRFGSL